MKILYIVRKDMDETTTVFLEEHKKTNEVASVDLRRDRDYKRIIEDIVSCDKIISC